MSEIGFRTVKLKMTGLKPISRLKTKSFIVREGLDVLFEWARNNPKTLFSLRSSVR